MLDACADADTLAAFAAGELAESERAAIAIHAAACEACHAIVESIVGADGASTELAAGTRVGRYAIGERLGAGGMGVVYAATDTELHRRVAVKLLREGGATSRDNRERMMREARVLASLSHPNVVTVFDIGTHDDALFLAMELVDGGSLAAWLASGVRAQADILDRLIDAARGLAAAHAAGVVHRDVKPDNILVGTDGRARVTDFGLARLDPVLATGADAPSRSETITRAGTRMGTPIYMAPEQLADGTTSARADQWSFCATIYEAVAGVRPFPSSDRAVAIAQGRLAPPKRPVPRWLVPIVQRGLRADPEARFPSMAALVAALDRGRKRRTRTYALAGAGVVAVAASVGFGFAHRSASVTIDTSSLVDTYKQGTKLLIDDPRPSCDCRMSACVEDRCVSSCNAATYQIGAPLPGVSLPGRQEALIGMASDASTVMYLADRGCVLDRLWVAHKRGDTYEPVDITDKLDRARVDLVEGCCTLAANGKSFVIARKDRHAFVQIDLATFAMTDLGDLIASDAPAVTALFPALSADERTLYYRISDQTLGPEDRGPLEGAYSTQRADRSGPFAAGARLPGRARTYDYVSAASVDGLSLFMASEYRTHVLVRPSTDRPFADPGTNMLPAILPGWRSVPTGDCRHIATTWAPAGCVSEDIIWLDAAER